MLRAVAANARPFIAARAWQLQQQRQLIRIATAASTLIQLHHQHPGFLCSLSLSLSLSGYIVPSNHCKGTHYSPPLFFPPLNGRPTLITSLAFVKKSPYISSKREGWVDGWGLVPSLVLDVGVVVVVQRPRPRVCVWQSETLSAVSQFPVLSLSLFWSAKGRK